MFELLSQAYISLSNIINIFLNICSKEVMDLAKYLLDYLKYLTFEILYIQIKYNSVSVLQGGNLENVIYFFAG